MFNSKFNGLLTGLLIAAIVGIVALLGFLGWSVYNKYYLNAKASDVVDAFEELVSIKKDEEEEPSEVLEIGSVEDTSSIYDSQKDTTTYYGYKILGTISIPKINIKYPILEKVSPQSIKVAVAYLSGVGINKVGNTVIQGHNYRNGLFFSNLSKLSNGDKIYITDQTGTTVEYSVYKVFEAESTDSSFYKRETNGLREVTLSTCTNDGKLRTIVLAKEVV